MQSQRQVNTGFVTARGAAVRRGRRSEQGQPELRRLGELRQPQSHPPVPRRARRGAKATTPPSAAAPAATSRGRSWRPTTRSTIARPPASAPTRTTGRCSRRRPTSRASSTSRRTTSTRSINIAALKKGKAAIAHKPLALAAHELRRTLEASKAERRATHLLAYSNTPDRHTLEAWIKAGVIGTVREVHNWTNRPFWPQGWQEYYKSGPPVPAGFNWTLWQGPEPDRPYHPNYTFCLYRGWYAYGTGCLGDMGFYSLWQPYRILNLGVPECGRGPAEQRRHRERPGRQQGRTSSPRSAFRRPARSAGVMRRPRHVPRSTRSGTTAATSRRRPRNSTRTRKIWPTRGC